MIAIDPGPTHSGWVEMSDGQPIAHGHWENGQLRAMLAGEARDRVELVGCEWVSHFGKPAGRDLFETALWTGRFVERWSGPTVLVTRQTIKAHVCGDAAANGSHVRQALIDRFGGNQRYRGVKCSTCKGRGKTGLGKSRRDCPVWEIEPGPVAGFVDHHWSALAVAVTVLDRGVTCGVLIQGGLPW
jgi:hypothetical protein